MAGHDAIEEIEQTPSLHETSSRKRPRLDSGSRSVSADRTISSLLDKAAMGDTDMDGDDRPVTPQPGAAPAQKVAGTPSRVTINVREPPKGDATLATNGRRGSASSAKSSKRANGVAEATESSTSSSTPAKSPSSPLIEIADTQSDGDVDVVTELHLEDEGTIADIYYDFPFSTNGAYVAAAELIAEDQKTVLNLEVLGPLNLWLHKLHAFLGRNYDEWLDALYEHEEFWEVIAKIYARVFSKSFLKQTNTAPPKVIESLARSFLSNFAALLARVLEVDATVFAEHENPGSIDRSLLISPNFVTAAMHLLREDKGFLAKVLPNLDVDANVVRAHFIKCFVELDGAPYLAQMVSYSLDDTLKDEASVQRLTKFLEFSQMFGVYAAFYLDKQNGLPQPSAEILANKFQEIFDAVDKQLLCSLEKQQDILNLETRRTLHDYQGSLLEAIFNLTPDRAQLHFQRVVGDEGSSLDHSHKEVAIIIWRIRLTIAYMMKGRMDLRLMGVETLAHHLVGFFNQHKDTQQGLRVETPSPVLCFVADYLLKEKITEYLFGVASHPQLISRCSNVIGFLVVTNKFDREQAQLVWRTIKDSPDPRVTNAAFPIFTNIVKSLTNFEDHVIFTEIVLAEPLPAMTPVAIEFFLELLKVLRAEVSDYHYHSNDKDERHYSVPLDLAVELMRNLSPTKVQLANAQVVYEHAAEVLSSMSTFPPPSVRMAFFRNCIDSLKHCREDGAAISFAIQSMIRQTRLVAKEQLQELRLATILMEEFCDFVSGSREAKVHMNTPLLNLQLVTRLDLIWSIVPLDDENTDKPLLKRFWSHLVGSDALSNTARDITWHRLTTIVFTAGMDSGFLEQHKELISPTEIDSSFFTPGYFQFIQKLATSQMRGYRVPQYLEDGSIEMPGLNMVWDAVLRAPKNVADDASLQYLITRYLDTSWLTVASRSAVEKTHVALVRRQVKLLKDAFDTIRQHARDMESGIDSGTGILMSEDSVPEAELMFLRLMKFLKKFLLQARSLKEYRPQGTVTIDMTDDTSTPMSSDTTLSIRCEIARTRQQTVTRTLIMDSQDMCKQLYNRICMLLSEYNVTCFQIITGGKRIYLKEQGRMTLEDVGIARTPHLLIREAHGADDARKDYIIPSEHWRSAFEQELVAHLDVLYGFLDGVDHAAALTRDLLKNLPRYPALTTALTEQTAVIGDLFSHEHPFRTCYSIDCLRDLLELGTTGDTFLAYGAQILESILPTQEQLTPNSTLSLEVVAETVGCLYDFFLAGRGRDLPLFSDAASVERRIISTCAVTLPNTRPAVLVWDSFEFAIDLVSSSESAWDEYTTNTDIARIYESLLLAHYDPWVRRHTAMLIQRKLMQWPLSPKVSHATFVMFLWKMVSEMVPRAVSTPHGAAELFEIVLTSFKSLLAQSLISEAEAATLFRTWAPLLVTHRHHEFVGRDEPDAILRGLAGLLFCIAETFPDIIPAEDKIKFIEKIFRKFLFQREPKTNAELAVVERELPTLETRTRTDLVAMIFALATDNEIINLVCSLFSEIDIRYLDKQVDKIGLLRSPAGYVGLKNLGQTCYMNSLMTQLFMNPVFRAFILSCAPLTKASTAPLLHETQRLFAIMQNSFHGYASAADFTRNIVTLTEEKIDPREQMDVDEFMNTLFHRWEEQMPSNDFKQRLRSVYTGKTVQQIKSKECEHVSEREDTCLAIPCDVQGNTTLEESLKAYVQGDVMEGDNKYKCERCDRLVDAVKRTCLKDVPDHLMLQLKRFAFDLETYSRNKINDLFAFPMSIDMSPYTFQHLANPDVPIEEDMFDLVGVIVHKGQAEHGHYVSYIRARPTADDESPTWLLFDDADVTVFDPKDFGEACFGGAANKDSGMMFQPSLKSYNAYMLFYQRRSSLQQAPWVADGSFDLRNVPIMPHMQAEVVQENRALLKEYSLLDESTRKYIRGLIRKLESLDHNDPIHDTQANLLQIIWKYITSVWVRTKEYPGIEEALASLREIGAKCARCCYTTLRWFISCEFRADYYIEDPLRDMLLRINQPKIRGYFRSFLLDAMKQIRDAGDLYGADTSETQPALTGRGAIVIITRLAQFIPNDISTNFRAWEDFFGLLADIASLGPQECFALISEGVLTACFDVILCGSGFNLQTDTTTYKEVTYAMKRKPSPPYNQVIRLASTLFNYVDMHGTAVPDTEAAARLDWYTEDGLPWTDREESILLDFNKKEGGLLWLCEVLQKWNYDVDAIAPAHIVKSLLHAKSALVHGVVETFCVSIKEFETRYVDPFLRLAKMLPGCIPSKELMDRIFRTMKQCSREANGSALRAEDGYNGSLCHRFWSAVHRIVMRQLDSHIADQAYFDKHFLLSCREWGPVLLAYTQDSEVGRLTQRLLSDSLFKHGPDLIAGEIRDLTEAEQAVTLLFWGCERQIRMFQAWRETLHQHFMQPTVSIMAECAAYLQEVAENVEQEPDSIVENERICSRILEVKAWFDDLPLQSDDDIGLGASELTTWEGLDLGEDTFAETSDLTEISDDEVGSLLTTNLEGS